MKRNVKDNLKLTLEELSACENHLNTTYLNAGESYNIDEIVIGSELTLLKML